MVGDTTDIHGFCVFSITSLGGVFEGTSFESYVRTLKFLVIDEPAPIFFHSYFIFGFMGVGYYVSRQRGLMLRIVIPIILAIFGMFIEIVAMFVIDPPY
ncbi:MAG: hypothetical protein U9N61_05505 [Euryarchaeota archaeon]|nr:hypothetical protein [Euryarchaeota archaeon]